MATFSSSPMESTDSSTDSVDLSSSRTVLVAHSVSDPPVSTFFGQLFTMIRRNMLLKRKSIKMTLVEFFIPVIFLGEFVFLGTLMRSFNVAYPAVPEFVDQPLRYPGAPIPNISIPIFPVGFTPPNDQAKFIMAYATEWWTKYNSSSMMYTQPFDSPEEMDKFYLNGTFPGVGLVFHDKEFRILNYSLRFPNEFVPPTSKPYLRQGDSSCRPLNKTAVTVATPNLCLANSYAVTGFSALQNLISAGYTKMKSNGSLPDLAPVNLTTKLMPEGPTTLLNGGAAVASMPATYLANLLGFYVIFLVIYVVTEKEKKHIESMKIMGLRASVYWLSWILLYAAIMLLVSVIALLLAKYLNIWPNSSFVLLLIDCMLFGGSVIALGFCIAPFFRRPLIAGLVTYALMQVFGFLYLVETFVPQMSDEAKFGIAILSPTAYFMSLSRVAQAEASGWGIGFGNAMDTSQSEFSFGDAIIMLAMDFVVYSLIAIYLEQVFPSDDTPKQRPWFFLLPSYWCGYNGPLPSYTASMSSLFDSGDVEPVPEELRYKTAVAMNGLRKVYPGSNNAVAVHDFTYEVYEDEILAVLGHNGAGKTTLINMITGMIAPTAGNALIYGKDVTKPEQLQEARKMIGICPQHNILFDTLTVREHIEFYARLKGFSNAVAKAECERILDEIVMRPQADQQSQKLSGGQKRRLCIAIAAVGNPRVLILDEPTSGVDPYSQRFLWDMIRGFRKNRCVIITTQSMQEADVFADRKLIMGHGRLRCAGTSLFLKNRFGLGYHLTMAIDKDVEEQPITETVQAFIGGAEKSRSHAGELSYILPKNQIASFPKLFNNLDENLERLHVKSYGVSLTTMEEIFLKLADEDTGEDVDIREYSEKMTTDKKRSYSRLASAVFARPEKGSVSVWTKFWALGKMRILLMLRSKLSLIFQFLIPFMLLVMNGGLTMMAREWFIKLQGSDPLNLADIGKDFLKNNGRYFFQNDTGSSLDGLLTQMSKSIMPFDDYPYANLLSSPNHFGGFIFRNLTTNETVPSASVVYNGTSTHGIPFTINMLLNAIFNEITGRDETFHVTTHPFPPLKATVVQVFDFMFGSLLVSLALIMIPGVYGIDVCRDRQIKIRSQIRMAGCSFWIYWGSAFFMHLIQFIASFAMLIGLLYAFTVTSVINAIGPVLILFAVHAPAIILFCYCLSFVFAKFETAAVGLPFPMAMISFVLYLIVFMLDAFGETLAAKVVHYILAFTFPNYGFFGAMIYIEKLSLSNSIANQRGTPTQGYFDWDSNIPIVMIAHAVQIPLLLLFLVFLESKHFNQNWLHLLGLKRSTAHHEFVEIRTLNSEDDDVEHERTHVRETNPLTDNSYAVMLRALWKSFEKRSRFGWLKAKLKCSKVVTTEQKVAVKNVSLIFPKGEIFGLLGPNGAGKTTTLSMITGEISPSSGDVHVNGYNLHTQTLDALESMGSCPQVDTIWEDITMREHLELFGILNDLPADRRQESIKTFTEGLYITEHLDKRASDLSGGTKRKLTFVISMIGNPPLVMLDEPSTGMDPQSKRNLWDMIMESFGGQRGAILTTHSMEEADALCDRIGIIVNGELKCIGSSQHLKNKFGSGYILEVKLSMAAGLSQNGQDIQLQKAKSAIKQILPRSQLMEEFYNRMVYSVPKEQVSSLGSIFADLDRLKQEYNLEEFSFSQTTIEQVFLHFARMQDVPDLPHSGSIPTDFSSVSYAPV
ncbi:cholesterol transporter ABCA5-like [Paramacrobiotus metropolitanus]|uniref:cholesterol transporter ABCA5-like n=1 Tax=Paramacrobiotus metropolitanus TaxID=2943436 RepID=UPI0024461044|nr:cholesterol transporter ABCA5-like [Paramacrobiotus metropolitanus]